MKINRKSFFRAAVIVKHCSSLLLLVFLLYFYFYMYKYDCFCRMGDVKNKPSDVLGGFMSE